MQETLVGFLGQEDCWRRDRLPTPVFMGFPCGSAGKEFACIMGDLDFIPGLERCPAEGKRNIVTSTTNILHNLFSKLNILQGIYDHIWMENTIGVFVMAFCYFIKVE